MNAYFHLPGLYEFNELYSKLIPLYVNHHDYFYDFAYIGSIYGSPDDTIFSGGRIEYSDTKDEDVINLMNKYNIPIRLSFSNSCLKEKDLSDLRSNEILKKFESENNGIIICSDLLLNYIKTNYPKYHFISSTTKVLTNYNDFLNEINNENFKYVVPDFRLNKQLDKLVLLNSKQKDKVEFLLNENCPISCKDRKVCYQTISRQILNENVQDHICTNIKNDTGYSFEKAKKNESFISIEDIKNVYLENGFSNFKIEGRTLDIEEIIEILLYYLIKPKYKELVKEKLVTF